ncbi:hypothetical protein [Candidatus Palauibacter sp.]|uniref:hypothetical protein n=1 Tax=Candidatus Palauibacter sp. TaxID=3101350 RepID=UPI003B028994
MSPGSRRASAAVAGTLAGLTLLAGVRPAAAQQDLGSVVCVASELESLSGSGPVRRVIRRDTELVYRVGVDLSARAEAEQALRAELETAGETSCAWSEPGQSHVIVVSYSGVVRRDLTIDPEDPRYQRFAVGYGTSWEEAEQFATTLNDHFATNYDGAGYEILVQETWSVARAAASPAAAEPTPARSEDPSRDAALRATSSLLDPPVPAEELCSGQAPGASCWMELADEPGCFLWNRQLRTGATATWTGMCSRGFAQGRGQVRWHYDGYVGTGEGLLIDGRRDGIWVYQTSEGWSSQGSFRRGQRHGTSVWCRPGRPRNVDGVDIYEYETIIRRYDSYDEIDDRQVAAEAASVCARLLPSGRLRGTPSSDLERRGR